MRVFVKTVPRPNFTVAAIAAKTDHRLIQDFNNEVDMVCVKTASRCIVNKKIRFQTFVENRITLILDGYSV